jgi:hypothetical protein
MIKVVFGEPSKDQKVVVPIHSNELYERIVVNIQNLKEKNNCIFVPAIFGNFDQVLTRQGIYNLFHAAAFLNIYTSLFVQSEILSVLNYYSYKRSFLYHKYSLR